MEIRIQHKLKGTYECRTGYQCGILVEVPELMAKVYDQVEASKKHENVVDGLHNLLWCGKEVKSMYYDMSTNEICLMVSELDWHLCPVCHLGYEGYPALSRKDNKTEICPLCGEKEALEAMLNN